MSENSCRDLKTGRFWLVRRSLGKGGWLFFRALSRHSRKATPDQTTIFISSTIFFQSNFAGLLKLPPKANHFDWLRVTTGLPLNVWKSHLFSESLINFAVQSKAS